MKIKTTLAVIALTLAPGLASAYCNGDKMKDETAAACAPGQTLDAATGTCVASPSS
jgi:hypothetical protein